MMRLVLAFAVWILLVGSAQAAMTVVDVRLGSEPDKTRFVVELSEAPKYRVFTLSDPYRVVIDFPELAGGALPERRGQGLIKALRSGLFAPGITRIVLDLGKPARLERVFLLAPEGDRKHRFVVDLSTVTPEAFLAEYRQRTFESDPPLKPAASATASISKRDSDSRPTIVIDPGHGGVDPGARSVSGRYEKEFTLKYARSLKNALEGTKRYRVILTREKDIFLQLRDRVTFANEAEGDLFLSLHANNHQSKKVRGASVYTLSETASDKEAEALAAKENKADIIAGINLTDQTEVVRNILIDLAQRETMNFSKTFANQLVEDMRQSVRMLGNSHRSAGFAVLKSPVVPSVLVELGHLSNPEEEKLLRSDAHREKVSHAIASAVNSYFNRKQSLN